MNQENLCYLVNTKVLDDIRAFVEQERIKIVRPNQKNMGFMPYVEEHLHISKNTWNIIEKNNILTSTAMSKMIQNKAFLEYMKKKGYIVDLTEDLF